MASTDASNGALEERPQPAAAEVTTAAPNLATSSQVDDARNWDSQSFDDDEDGSDWRNLDLGYLSPVHSSFAVIPEDDLRDAQNRHRAIRPLAQAATSLGAVWTERVTAIDSTLEVLRQQIVALNRATEQNGAAIIRLCRTHGYQAFYMPQYSDLLDARQRLMRRRRIILDGYERLDRNLQAARARRDAWQCWAEDFGYWKAREERTILETAIRLSLEGRFS